MQKHSRHIRVGNAKTFTSYTCWKCKNTRHIRFELRVVQTKSGPQHDLQRFQLTAHRRMCHNHLGGIHSAAQCFRDCLRFLFLSVTRRISHKNKRAAWGHRVIKNATHTGAHSSCCAHTCRFDRLKCRYGAGQRVVAADEDTVDVENERYRRCLHLSSRATDAGLAIRQGNKAVLLEICYGSAQNVVFTLSIGNFPQGCY